MKLYRCTNLECQGRPEDAGENTFRGPIYQGTQCPHCGTEGGMQMEIIHLLTEDRQGEIPGSNLAMGKRFSIVCGKPRREAKHMSRELKAVTCPDCLALVDPEQAE